MADHSFPTLPVTLSSASSVTKDLHCRELDVVVVRYYVVLPSVDASDASV